MQRADAADFRIGQFEFRAQPEELIFGMSGLIHPPTRHREKAQRTQGHDSDAEKQEGEAIALHDRGGWAKGVTAVT